MKRPQPAAQALRDCTGWVNSNVLALALPGIEKATEKQIDELLDAANNNTEVRTASASEGTSDLNTAKD